ncbi:MAG: multidrug efflux MFS transporter [Dehalococcoidia bacterium]|nr:multidrug efflux MFS transporter [Dehalococcoidia bacterium]MYD28720.1 multidrug efflux MFS transporter [Dehalococcoidia bacterium]
MRLEHKYIVALISVFGMFMNLLDLTIVNVAVPVLAFELDASAQEVQWVVTAYLLAVAVGIPVSGWAGDRFGTKLMFVLALAFFTIGSALCAFAWNIESLIVFRGLQGLGGGLLMPVSQTMVFRAFPQQERSKAAGILIVPTTFAPASGPLVGGIILDYLAWPWIFLVNIPVGVIAIVLAIAFLREQREDAPGRIDIPGLVLASGGLAVFLYGLAEAGERGFGDPVVLGFGGAGLVLLALFVLVELRTEEPLIDVRLFANRLFAVANASQAVAFMGFSATLFLLPLILQLERGLSPFESGLATFPQAIGVMVMAPLLARIYPIVGPRRLVAVGLLAASATTVPLILMDLETDLWWVRGTMFARGVGFSMMLVPLQTAAFAQISMADTGRATAALNATRQVAQSFGVAIIATVLTSRLAHYGAALGPADSVAGSVSAFSDGFVVTAIFIAAGVLVALLIRDRDAAATLRARLSSSPG